MTDSPPPPPVFPSPGSLAGPGDFRVICQIHFFFSQWQLPAPQHLGSDEDKVVTGRRTQPFCFTSIYPLSSPDHWPGPPQAPTGWWTRGPRWGWALALCRGKSRATRNRGQPCMEAFGIRTLLLSHENLPTGIPTRCLQASDGESASQEAPKAGACSTAKPHRDHNPCSRLSRRARLSKETRTAARAAHRRLRPASLRS